MGLAFWLLTERRVSLFDLGVVTNAMGARLCHTALDTPHGGHIHENVTRSEDACPMPSRILPALTTSVCSRQGGWT